MWMELFDARDGMHINPKCGMQFRREEKREWEEKLKVKGMLIFTAATKKSEA